MKIILSKRVLTNFKTWALVAFVQITLSHNGVSQIQKGNWIIGGDAGFSYFKYYTTKTSSFSLAPTGGYFFLNRLAVGLRPSYVAEFNTSQAGRKSRESLISLTPFIRYYFLTYERKFNLLADGGFGYSWGKFKNYSNPDFNYHSKIISFKAGPAIFLNERTAIEITLGYNHSIRGSLGDTLGISSFQIGVGLQVHIGKRNE